MKDGLHSISASILRTTARTDLDTMQCFITRMDIRNVSIGVPEPSSLSAHDLIIVPNPAYDYVGFIVDGVISNLAPFTITNALGQVVLAGRADHNGTVDIRGLASGCYAVTLLDKSGVRMRTAQFVRQ